jgi:hypothetical protein
MIGRLVKLREIPAKLRMRCNKFKTVTDPVYIDGDECAGIVGYPYVEGDRKVRSFSLDQEEIPHRSNLKKIHTGHEPCHPSQAELARGIFG